MILIGRRQGLGNGQSNKYNAAISPSPHQTVCRLVAGDRAEETGSRTNTILLFLLPLVRLLSVGWLPVGRVVVLGEGGGGKGVRVCARSRSVVAHWHRHGIALECEWCVQARCLWNQIR